MKNIKKYYDFIFYTYLFPVKNKKILLIISIMLLTVSCSWLYGYKFRDNKIYNLKSKVYDLKFYNDSIVIINDSLNYNLIEFDSIKKDGDYYRFIAFKYAKILVPEKMNSDDIILIHQMSKKYNIPIKYIYRLVWKESKYNPSAKSNMGASGYMQVMPATFNVIKKKYEAQNGNIDQYDKNKQNILIGTFYLHYLYQKYQKWDLTFAAYNAGSGNVQAAGNKVPNIPETKQYVSFIMKK